MRRWALVVVAALLALAVAMPSVAQTLRVYYIQTRTVTNGVALAACTAASTPANCSADVTTVQLFCTVETGPIRWFANGTNPTTAVGHIVNTGGSLSVAGSNLNIQRFRMIATTATDATVTCSILRP